MSRLSRSLLMPLLPLASLAACVEPVDPAPAVAGKSPLIAPLIENIDFVARHGGTCAPVGPGQGPNGLTWYPTKDEVTPCAAGATDCLQKVVIDTAVYPDAVCNDGSPAVMYVRINPVSTHWIIHWQGGADCATYDECYERWCQLEPYSASKMSSVHTPDAMAADGIFASDPANMFRIWNVVYGYYCSSDTWRGAASAPTLRQPAQLGVSPQAMRVRFNGRAIADAIVGTLQNGAVVATADGGEIDLPDLDLADQVLFTGSSAGAIGLRHLVDAHAAQLRAANPDVDVRAAFDSTHKPLAAFVTDALDGTCDSSVEEFADSEAEFEANSVARNAVFQPVTDASCLAAHPADPQRCASAEHVLAYHVTTPFFARQALLEKLGDDDDDGTPDVDGELWKDAAREVIQSLDDLGRVDPTTGEVREPVLGEVGWFAPDCNTHTAIDGRRFFDEEITTQDGSTYDYETTLSAWIAAVGRRRVVEHDGGPVIDNHGFDRRSVCPFDDPDHMPVCVP